MATSAGNEQRHNAFQLQQVGATVALVKEAATAEGLRTAVSPVLTSPERREQIADQARVAGRTDAADRLTNVLLHVATEW
ncbi:glycosyltransferase [Streptomyces bobili]|uniref:glycosyltransferase n=1 Tax=Streptomyces bobili TaxID=67280 RepID=UPI0033A7D972